MLKLAANDPSLTQGGHSPGKPGKPGKVREFQSCQGKVKANGKSQGKVRETEICFSVQLTLKS